MASAQMTSPLKGQGSPSRETQDVFISCYLDRLLNVDVRSYRFEATFVFYMSWNDSQAHYTIANTTAHVAAGQHECGRPCTDWADDMACCDGIFIPSFFFRNAYHFSQDRVTGYKIYALPPPNGSVLWTQVVQGEFYQPMDLSHYPFDSFDLLLALEFLDTSEGTHPGLTVHTSSGGTHLLGLGDAVSDWHIDSITLTSANNINSGSLFKLQSAVPSSPLDPLPLSTRQAAVLRGTLPGTSSLSRVNVVRMVFVKIKVSRFSSYHVLNTILPVALLGMISFVVFFLHRRDLAARLGVIVTLFLALAAVQFVISSDQPSSSYVLPTQQQVVATYCLLALMAVEAIVVYHIETWKEHTERAKQRQLARDRFCMSRRQGKAAAAAASAVAAADAAAAEASRYQAAGCAGSHQQEGQTRGAAGSRGELSFQGGGECIEATSDAGACDGVGGAGSISCGNQEGPKPQPDSPRAGKGRRLTRIRSLQADIDYDAYCAYVVDRAALATLLAAYVVATILIFTLQQGYINLFEGL
ncbi:hypothetical protein N2152v2_007996 [Parachlorella kessleri]